MNAESVPGSTDTSNDQRRVLIREAVPDDAPAILRYLQRVGGESEFLTFGAEGVGYTEDEEREAIARYQSQSNSVFLLALAGDDIVGSLTFQGEGRPRVRHIGEFGVSVAAAFHGRGVGRALVSRLIEWARAGGEVRKVNLRVRVDNLSAIRLYERLGFQVEGRLTRDLCVGGVFHDVLAMGLQI
jgi:RimJ/RimL family protein N-acetyltransferase